MCDSKVLWVTRYIYATVAEQGLDKSTVSFAWTPAHFEKGKDDHKARGDRKSNLVFFFFSLLLHWRPVKKNIRNTRKKKQKVNNIYVK